MYAGFVVGFHPYKPPGDQPRLFIPTLKISLLGGKINRLRGIEGQGHLARQDMLWIFVLVTNEVDLVIGSETATKLK